MSGSCIPAGNNPIQQPYTVLDHTAKAITMTKLGRPQNCIYTKLDFIRVHRGRKLNWNSYIKFESRITCANLK